MGTVIGIICGAVAVFILQINYFCGGGGGVLGMARTSRTTIIQLLIII